MTKRKSLSKSLRFEVFKRDKFTCQYCGRTSPDVVLEVDHIIPVAKGGTNDITNLITACYECNRGKSDKKLNDNQEIKLQQKELKKLADRKEQLEMMSKWKIELSNIENEEVDKVIEIINVVNNLNINFSPHGRMLMKKYIKSYGLKDVMDAASTSYGQYKDLELAFKRIPGIIRNRKNYRENEELYKNIFYLRAIVRNRFGNINEKAAFYLLKICVEDALNDCQKDDLLEVFKETAIESKNWAEWKEVMETYISENNLLGVKNN